MRHFCNPVTQDCIVELEQEVKHISDIEEQAQVLLKSTLVATINEANSVNQFRPTISTQNTVGTNFISSIDQGSPDSIKRDYVTQWLSQDGENGACTICYDDFDPGDFPTEFKITYFDQKIHF